jgi:catalase
MYIPLNTAAYSPNTLNKGSPRQANQTTGRGFFTAPNRSSGGKYMRTVSPSFADVWSQARLFFNSLLPVEQQFVVNAMRFETAQLTSDVVKNNVLIQLNRVSHDIATRVATALGMTAPEADPTYYHDNKTINVSVAKDPLLKLDGLKVGYLTSKAVTGGNSNTASLKTSLAALKVKLVVVSETLGKDIDQTYSTTDATQFDAIIIGEGTDALFSTSNATASAFATLYPAGRPLQILQDGYRFGKPVAAVGSGSKAFEEAGIKAGTPGVFGGSDVSALSSDLEKGLKQFKFLDRYPLDQ